MNIQRLGTELGGWTINLDDVPYTGTVIEAGTGLDTSFVEELAIHRPNLKYVLIDPTLAARDYALTRPIPNMEFICAAVSHYNGEQPLYELLQHSPSLRVQNRNVDRRKFLMCACISLEKLVKDYRPCLMKMDLEGEEFKCYKQSFGVKQVAFEFHHRIMRGVPGFREENTVSAVSDFLCSGYRMIARSPYDQYTFLRGSFLGNL